MKTKIIKALAYIALVTLGLYFVGSFLSMSFNAFDWQMEVRLCVAIFWVVFMFMVFLHTFE